MLGEKLRELRIKNNWTQKYVADKIFVTAQAVSRWEKNEVEPSIKVLTELAELFNVSVDELISNEMLNTAVITENSSQDNYFDSNAQARPVLAVCEQCNNPIYEGKDIVRINMRGRQKIICETCRTSNVERLKKEAIARGLQQRKRSFIKSGIFAGIFFILSVVAVIMKFINPLDLLIAFGITIVIFTFTSCLTLKNNFIEDMIGTITEWGFIRFPGVIFSLDLDGLIWFLTVKLAFWILGYILAIICFILGCLLGMILSVFVYPVAIVKNYRHPEETDVTVELK